MIVEKENYAYMYVTMNVRRSNTVSPVKKRAVVQSQYVIQLDFMKIVITFRHKIPNFTRFFHVLRNIKVLTETDTSPLLVH